MKNRLLCKVLDIREISTEIYEMVIGRPEEMGEILPGQFLHIQCSEGEYPLLRRPISVCKVEENCITLVIRKFGRGTELLCAKKVGDLLDVLGPLGNGFEIEGNKVMIVGGGIGVAPLLELTRRLENREKRVLLGYRNETYLIEEFQKYAKDIHISTEDGSVGHKGYVTQVMIEEIERELPEMVYACGPEVMLKEVQRICKHYGIKSQFALEERMACGIGACLVCSCKIQAEQNGWKYARTCKEGPVFSGDEVIFDV